MGRRAGARRGVRLNSAPAILLPEAPMRRIVLMLVLGFMPLAGGAQQAGKVPRVGVLYPGGSAPLSLRMEAFRQGLRESGYVEGNTVAIESRYADGRSERLVKLAADLVQREVSVIATSGDLATRVVQQATATIPIVAFT